jgi:hypothetical protein
MHRYHKTRFCERAVMLRDECLSIPKSIFTDKVKVHDCLLHPEQECFSVRPLIPEKLVFVAMSIYFEDYKI